MNWENNLKKNEIVRGAHLLNASTVAAAAAGVSKADVFGSNITSADVDIDRERANNIYIYSGIMAIVLYLVVQRLFGFVHLCLRASNRLHAHLMRGVMQTSTHFFCVNDSGRLLNRFSKDISVIDTAVPAAVYYSIYVNFVPFFHSVVV